MFDLSPSILLRLGDIPLTRVKFNTTQVYEYVNNFKILQRCFTDHAVEKVKLNLFFRIQHSLFQVIPVERLVNCKFQDNLEFLQWVKKYWDTYYPGGHYDAVSRRQGKGGSAMKNSVSSKSLSSGSGKSRRGRVNYFSMFPKH